MLKVRHLLAAAVAAVVGFQASATDFTFAGFTFDQDDTPDVFGVIGDGVTLGGAAFSSGFVEDITSSVGFGADGVSMGAFVSSTGFDAELSLGEQAFDLATPTIDQSDGSDGHWATAINMPEGNNGSSTRHGLEVSWSGGRTLTNLGGGDEFVIYESASNSTSPEGFMVRARNASTGGFSDWFFQANDAFENYLSLSGGGATTTAGAMAHAFDLSDLGFAVGEAIDLIQIANLISADTLAAGMGTRQVLFDGSGSVHGFGSSALDPDPLYVGVLDGLTGAAVVPAPAALPAGMALLGVMGLRRKNRHAA